MTFRQATAFTFISCLSNDSCQGVRMFDAYIRTTKNQLKLERTD